MAAGGRHAFLRQHRVLVFRNQPLTGSQYLAFARRIAGSVEYPLLRGLPDYPLIVPVVKQPHERVNFGGLWHSDTAYLDTPPVGATRLARDFAGRWRQAARPRFARCRVGAAAVVSLTAPQTPFPQRHAPLPALGALFGHPSRQRLFRRRLEP
jgi:alpha-ketoglutarate-dependent taurine dioxygenase